MAEFVAVISKSGEPLYFHSSSDTKRVRHEFLALMALDAFEARDYGDCGLLLVHSNIAVYGFKTHTGVKIAFAIDASTIASPSDVSKSLKILNRAYSGVSCNPFYVPPDKIHSAKFQGVVDSVMNYWN
ncbi:hypothetical protein CANCADRAFT_4405 [Tortispora caseinolytica NRRL Y-17796]|uniref:Trafficking protein particle complex subunit n=1 Tax=Tortispora caseinolytica NRRL Y-17796 TaxID=767744 RepID=A0A1E4TDG1_9ASCO|nr:hypothetical protein CANCADRAFT_4405 [Tortispora caseinolytica NRRL Y-17796]